MRNTNWTIIALALVAAAAIFYFMKQSDFMKPKEAATAVAEMATSMDDGNAEAIEEDVIMSDPYGEDESLMEEEVD